jgi:DNA-binding CsgD family transcriptional regulator
MSSTTNLEAAVLYGKWKSHQLAVPQLIEQLKTRCDKDEKNKNFRQSLEKHHMSFACNGREVMLNQREFECLVRLIQGKTNKVIGVEIGLSHRTIEYYIDNLKAKVGCSKKRDIIHAVKTTEFFTKLLSSKAR